MLKPRPIERANQEALCHRYAPSCSSSPLTLVRAGRSDHLRIAAREPPTMSDERRRSEVSDPAQSNTVRRRSHMGHGSRRYLGYRWLPCGVRRAIVMVNRVSTHASARHGFEDGQRGTFDDRGSSPDYREGFRAGKDAAGRDKGQNRGDDRRDDRRDQDSQNAHLPGSARRACIDQATANQSFGPDQVSIGDVRDDEGMFKVDLRTPAGRLRCVVDRDGNIRSMDHR